MVTLLKNRMRQIALLIVAGAATSAATHWYTTHPAVAEKSNNEKAVNDPAFHKQLLQIAAEYKDYGKVDDMSRWAPWLCSAPLPPKARLSKSNDGSTHGQKLYFLFAKNRNSYVEKTPADVGQVVVKQSWLPDPSSAGSQNPKPTTQTDLFIMFKTDPKTRNTDEGWVYGTVTSDGKTVTSAGRVQSCMKCHINVPNGRLFGLKDLKI